ncbi:hypothetical protein PLESTM_000919500 [Pleodorina starrii]|nr:hypothetical protein PLESTM_000919500 [Pleodorina starrii]
MDGMVLRPSSGMADFSQHGTCNLNPTSCWANDGRESLAVQRPPASAVDGPLLPLREPAPPPCSTAQQRWARPPRIIRARPLGESIELQSSEDSSDEDGRGRTCHGRRRACGHRVARGWSRFVAAARSAIEWPPADPDGDPDGDGVDGDGVGGGATAHPSLPQPPISLLEGLRQLLLVAAWDIIHPDSRFRSYWDGFIVACLMYVAFVTTFLLCFHYEDDNRISAFEAIDFLIWGAFLLDIPFNFRTALRRGEDAARRHTVLTSRRLIAVNYLTGWFVVDVLAALPWGNITSSLSSFMQLLKLLRLIRLARLLEVSKRMHRSALYQNVEQSQGAAVVRVLAYIIGGVLVLHMSASAWFFLAVIQDKGLTGTWAEAAGLQDAGNFERYLTSLYFVVITYTTVGYGDVFPVTTAERCMACVGMLIGVVTLGYIISTANSIAGRANKYEISRSELMDSVEDFLSAQSLPTALATRVKSYYCYVAAKQFNDKEDEDMVAALPCDLRRDVLRSCHARLIARVPFLRDASRHHEALVLELSAALKLEFYGKGECVVMEGGWDTEMYFVTEGRLQVRQYLSCCGGGREAAAAAAGQLSAPTQQQQQQQQQQLGTDGPSGTAIHTATIASTSSTPAGEPRDGGGRPASQQPAAAAACPNSVSSVQQRLGTAAGSSSSGGGGVAGGGLQARGCRGDVVLEMYGGSAALLTPPTATTPPQASIQGGPEPMNDDPRAAAAAAAEAADVAAAFGSGSGSRMFSTGASASSPLAARPDGDVTLSPPPLAPSSSSAAHIKSQTEFRRRWRMSYDCTVPYKAVRTLKPGSYFGEYGCLTGCPRTASVVAVRMTEVYGMRRGALKEALGRWPELDAAWKGGRAPRAMSLPATDADAADAGGPYDSAAEEAVSSQKRYQDFMSYFGCGGGDASGVAAAVPADDGAAGSNVGQCDGSEGV